MALPRIPARPGPAARPALAGLVLAFLALLGGAGNALAQSCPEPTDLWCATMTVGYVNDAPFAGYDADGPGAVYLGLDGGTLEPDRFVHDGVEYTIDFLYNSTTDTPLGDGSPPLALGISPALPAEARDGLVLHLDTEALALSDAVDGGEFELGLVWLGTARKSLNVTASEGLWPYFSTVAVRLAAAVTVPDAPIGLAADVEAGAVTLTWIRPSDGGAALGEYEYRVSADGGTNWSPDWSAISGSGAGTVAHEVTGLTSDTAYTFEVRAVNGEGAGPAARVDATPHAPRVPDAPGDLGAIAGAGAVILTWTPPYSGNGPLTGYEYRVSADGGTTWSPGWSTIPGGGPGTVAYEVTGLTDDTAYTFEVRAVNGRGEGPAARTSATPSASAVAPAVTVSFGAASYRAFEGERGLPATVEVRLSEVPGREVEVALTATGAGGATADDWNAPASVTFVATETSKTFELTAGDAPNVHDYDPGESVVLGFGDLPEGVAPDAPATATVHLHNDEKVPVEFWMEVPDDLRISESGGEVTIVGRTLGNEPPEDVYVNARIIDVEGDGDTPGFDDNIVPHVGPGTGTLLLHGRDYSQEGEVYVGRKTIPFTPAMRATGFDVEDDEEDENDEYFTLSWRIIGRVPEGGLALAVKGDTRFTRTRSKATRDAGGSPLPAATGDVWLQRLGVEGSRRFALGADGAGTTLTPRFEIGARLDGGDAETGLGADLGAGVTLAAPRHGLMLVLNARGLLAHEASGLRESGASASLAWDPRPTTDRGLALTLRQGWGGSPAGGMNALLGRETLAGLAADPGLGAGAGDNGGTASAGRLEAELGYGIALFGGGFTGTPNIGIGLSDTARDYRLGWRLKSARKGAAGFELGLDATRREAAGDDAEHGLAVRLSIRW